MLNKPVVNLITYLCHYKPFNVRSAIYLSPVFLLLQVMENECYDNLEEDSTESEETEKQQDVPTKSLAKTKLSKNPKGAPKRAPKGAPRGAKGATNELPTGASKGAPKPRKTPSKLKAK